MRVVNKGAALRIGHIELQPGVNQIDVEMLRTLLLDTERAAAYDAQCEPWSHEFAGPTKPGQFVLGADGENSIGRGVLR